MSTQVYDLEERLLEYSARIIRLVERLPAKRSSRHVADQLLRSGTSPLANHGEAQAAESRDDFIHKLSICLKELRESRRWPILIRRVPLMESCRDLDLVIGETEALIKMFAKSLITTKSRRGS